MPINKQPFLPEALFNKTTKNSETHGEEHVALYPCDPGSEALHGVMEQNEIFDVITGALGW